VSKAGATAGSATLQLTAHYPDTRRHLLSYFAPDMHAPLFMFLHRNCAAMSELQLSRAHSKVWALGAAGAEPGRLGRLGSLGLR
jgi:hypothetical protein